MCNISLQNIFKETSKRGSIAASPSSSTLVDSPMIIAICNANVIDKEFLKFD